ncbi:PREDICTED: disease resistance protein RRS1 isoform X2 [Brassica oleracea var. oleracea]|nr:PREDICTED: disease resistance protein RRS1 isoform X2 [Brassica oleracea var. oleracea]
MASDTNSLRYKVYFSFHKGEDTIRYSFVSHLSASLRRKGLIPSASLFVDNCSNGTRTEKHNFKAFVVVLSEKYVLSSECLDELAEIVDRQRDNQNVVVPVFYSITQSEVMHKSRLDILRDTFPLESNSAERVTRWIGALKKTVESYKPRMDYGDCELVEEIARDVYEKMFPTKRIGIYSRLLELENFLCKQPWGVRSIGIWGMPGIGKTTLAKAAFDQFSGDYEVSCFIKDFDKEFHMKGIYYLLQEYLGGTVREELDINNYVMEPEPKRVLIVLDNVCKPLDADAFLNGFDWFGPGSLIIITSRDKQVFVQCGVNQIYEVQGFNVDEAKKLFSSGIDWSKRSGLDTLEPYLRSVIQYSSGNPLALSFYGKELLPKNIEEIETELLSLKQIPPPLIMEAIKISYYTLNDSERTMFLDIACFFRGENVDYVMQLFEGCGFFPHVGISVLVDKCLVTILEGKMQMHDLIQVVAKEISNEETVQLERHCRLWDASIIQSLLEDKEPKSIGESMGIEDIEAIFLDISNLEFYVNPNAFKSIHNLRFLKIYSSNHGKHQGLGIYKSLESLPNELRLLHWENYPLNYLPHDFDPSHLVELNMPYSKLEKLWDGIKNLEMLKTIKLCHSQELVEINDISNAQNVEVIDLQGCIKFPSFPATGHLQHLRVINLSGCVEIKSFTEVPPNIEALYLSGTSIREILTLTTRLTSQCRNCIDCLHVQTLDFLRVLDLSGCSRLEEIQCFPRNMKELNLSDTAIRKISSSIGHLTALEVLNLTNCKRLQHLPMGMSNLTSLVKLMLTGCSNLEHIQDLPTGLKELYLAETAIRELPSSICHLSELVVFDAENCQKLQDLPTAIGNLNSLSMLKLSGCLELEDIHDLPRNLKILNLAETPIRKMPSSFEDLTELISVDLNHCKRLQHLQMGSYKSLVRIELSGCSDLDSIIGFSLQDVGQHHIDGIEKVRLCGPPPCNVIFIWENWRTFHVIPGEKMGSKCCMKLTPFLASPYRSKLPSSFLSSLVSSMYALVSLLLSNANLLDIPQEICHFPSLKTLDLSGNDFSKLPKSMKQLCKLESLILCRCKKLKSLPELPQCLETLNAHGCVSLKNVHRSFEQFPRHCTFSNCFNISSDSVKNILDNSIAHMARHPCQNLIKAQVSSFSVPAFTGLNSIFHLQRSSSVKIRINHIIKLLGFKITVVVAFWDDSRNAASFGIRCVCRWKNKKGLSRRLERVFYCWTPEDVAQSVLENHMFVFCDVSMHLGIADGNDHDILDDLIVFEFVPVNGQNRVLDDCCTITECGVDVITEKTDKASHDLRRPGSALDSMELSSYVLPQFKKRKRSFSGSKDIEMEHDRLILSETNRRVASDMAPLSSSSLSPRPRYDVFLSFYEDVRRTFVSYLIKEFKWLGITAVYSGLVGCEVTSHPEVTEAIKKSRISVVILSKNYVSSSRCLNELVEIITWSKETWGYRVIPVYYEVDPSYVRKQTKTIGKGLVGTFLGKVEKPEVKWRRALTYIVDEVGESSQDWNDDTKMIEKIATNVSKQVDVMESNGFDTVFIKETEDIEEFETNIRDKLDGVHIIPSWYMYAFSLIYLCLLASQSDYITPSVYI